jgi:hypothetical protein
MGENRVIKIDDYSHQIKLMDDNFIQNCILTMYNQDKFIEDFSDGSLWRNISVIIKEMYKIEFEREKVGLVADLYETDKRIFNAMGTDNEQRNRVHVHVLIFGNKEDRDKFMEKEKEELLTVCKKIMNYERIKV